MKRKSRLTVQTETERRFLVYEIDPATWAYPHSLIKQAYFDTPDAFSLRVRIVDDRHAKYTRKTGSGLSRGEEEIGSDDLELAAFLHQACVDKLTKTRYVRDGWEVDYFHGPLEGLVLAEFESPDAGKAELPPWVKRAVEVTDSLNNRHLARIATDLADVRADLPIREYLTARPKRVVLTGGPCCGKSTAMEALKREFGERLHFVPEVATIVIGQVGAKPPPPNDELGTRTFQRTFRRIQAGFEAVSDMQAVRDGKAALLLDRGTVDIAAYVTGGVPVFERVCGTTIGHEYSRYDLVLCLDVPSRPVYDAMRGNNVSRSENYEQARRLGDRTRAAWRGHPNFRFVRNFPTWAKKLAHIRREVAQFLKT